MIEPENARLESMPDDRRRALAAVAEPRRPPGRLRGRRRRDVPARHGPRIR
ncbi:MULTISPECIES: hypothetical protein [unclassified Streptomyces]|uniref:hypothetical protein n=1 Tax=unclassified Streptomyces TaxID=2593676 RepID=UPI0036CB22F1